MNIGIIGAGNVGKAIATSATRAGHQVRISARHRDHAAAAATASGARAVETSDEAVRESDIVILAVPYSAIDEVANDIRTKVRGKTVVDVTNPLTPDYSGLATTGTSAAEQLQSKLPDARVVKAFNSALAARQADPKIDGTNADGFVAGDDEDAKRKVLDLVRSIGFRPIDVGPLAMARHLESLAFLNISLQSRHKWPWQAAWKLVGPTPQQEDKTA